jgi:vacuolar protein sorting-associated protein 13A/C
VFEDVAIQAFGVAFTNIEEAIITITGITLSNSYETIDGIINKLVVHYKRNFFNEVYKVFGSLNIIGNPMGLFNNITTGLTDLIQRPVEGAVKGPIELGRGIVSGTHSLVSHTVGGAFNSLSQITQSVSNGLTILCFDKRYELIRDKERMIPPKGIIDGLSKGVTSLYIGVREGVIG